MKLHSWAGAGDLGEMPKMSSRAHWPSNVPGGIHRELSRREKGQAGKESVALPRNSGLAWRLGERVLYTTREMPGPRAGNKDGSGEPGNICHRVGKEKSLEKSLS